MKRFVKALLLGASAMVLPAVASAASFDVTGAGSTATVNTAIFEQAVVQPAGTGVIRSFVRLQSPGSSEVEEGYNTDGRPTPFNENNSPQFTRSVLLNQVIVVNKGGTDYRQFLLDVNEPGNIDSDTGLISLDQVKIFLGTTGDQTTTNLADLGTPVYDLDAGEDNVLVMRDRQAGSGESDYFMYVPNSLFTAAFDGSNPFVYLYSRFGDTNPAEGGFEEWAAVIPLPPAVWMGLITMAGAAVTARKRMFGKSA